MPPLQQLLQQLHEQQHPYSTQFDDRLLIALLLAVAAGHRNLVVRVNPLDAQNGVLGAQSDTQKGCKKDWIKRVADEVEWICAVIFAVSTHRVTCSPKTPPSAFVKSLFLPSPERAGREGPRSRRADGRRAANRSSSAPLDAVFPGAGEAGTGPLAARRPRSPGLLEPLSTARRQHSASETVAYPSSAPPSRLTFEEPLHAPYSGRSSEAGDSSAGEDLYPTPLSSSLGRRNTLSPKLRSDSPERRRVSGRRHTLGAKDLLRPGAPDSLIGLGLGGTSTGSGNPGRMAPPRPGGGSRPPPPRTASGSGYFGPSSRSPLHQHTSYMSQAERRPSIASIQSTFSTSTPTPPTPTANRFLRSGPGPPSPLAPNATYVTSPLSAAPSPSFVISPADLRTASPRASSPTPSRTRHTPQPSATYPPITRPTASSGSASGSSERTLPQVLILEHLERARPSAQQTLLAILRDERIVISSMAGGNGSTGTSPPPGPRRGTPAPAAGGDGADDASSMRTRRTAWTVQTREDSISAGGVGNWEGSWNLPEGFMCVAVVWDEDKSGSEGHDGGWGGVSRHLLDHFSLSHAVSSTTLLSPSRFHAPDPAPHQPHPLAATPRSVLSPLPLPSSALPSYLSDTLDTYLSDLLSALRHHPQIEGRMLTARAVRELREMVKVWVGLTKGAGAVDLVPPASPVDNDEKQRENYFEKTAKGDKKDSDSPLILPADVLAVLLSILGHRLALRKPRDEKSLFWGSDRGALEARRGGTVGGKGRRKIEDVVREVVAAV
ncbi:hypothetical protein JCM11251_001457 [Rhodosporidiobolus azoricus]